MRYVRRRYHAISNKLRRRRGRSLLKCLVDRDRNTTAHPYLITT